MLAYDTITVRFFFSQLSKQTIEMNRSKPYESFMGLYVGLYFTDVTQLKLVT